MTEWSNWLVALIAALGGGSVVVAWMRRQVTAAEAAKAQAEAARAQAEAARADAEAAKALAEAAKVRADADLTTGDGWEKLLMAQQRQMDRMAAEIESLRLGKIACEAELGEMRRRLAALERATGANRASTPKLDAPRKGRPVNGSAT